MQKNNNSYFPGRSFFMSAIVLGIFLQLSASSSSVFSQRKSTTATAASSTGLNYARGLERYAALHGLIPLAQESLDGDEFEIRVRVLGSSIFYPRALILSKRKGIQTAVYINGELVEVRDPMIANDLSLKSSQEL